MPSSQVVAQHEPGKDPSDGAFTEFYVNAHGGGGSVAQAQMYVSSAVETVIAAVDTPVKALGTTTLVTSPAAVDFTMPANNRLTYGGDSARTFFATAAISAIAAGNNKLLAFYLAKNGVVIPDSELRRFVGTGADEGAITIQALVSMTPTDYLELWVENQTDNVNLTVNKMSFVVAPVS